MDSAAFFVNTKDERDAQICFEYYKVPDDPESPGYLSQAQGVVSLRPLRQMPDIMINDVQGITSLQSPRQISRIMTKDASSVASLQSPRQMPETIIKDAPAITSLQSPRQTTNTVIEDARAVKVLHSSRQMPEMIKDYLATHESWDVPASVMFEETNASCIVPDELAASPEFVGDELEPYSEENFTQVKIRKRGGRRHKGHFMKRPMATAEVIEELKDNTLRENALRCLSGHLIERRETDPEFYRQAGFFLFHSCGTLAVLLQEILVVYERIYAGDLNVRGSKRLGNVLCLLQSIAANSETRLPFLKAGIPNYLIPFIRTECTEEIYENLRTLSLSIIGILCQLLAHLNIHSFVAYPQLFVSTENKKTREKDIIKWALQNDIIDLCLCAVYFGNELSKVVAMTILDSILRVDEGLAAICQPKADCDMLPEFINMCDNLVSVLAAVHGFSPRLLFLVVRCYILLCQDCRALGLLKQQLPAELQDTTFCDIKMEYPIFSFLRHQLLLNVGKAMHYLPSAPGSLDPSPPTPVLSSNDQLGGMTDGDFAKLVSGVADIGMSPVHPIDFNRQNWLMPARIGLVM